MSQPTEKQQRSEAQNAAMHVYFTLLADALIEAGMDMHAVMKPGVEIPPTKENVKEIVWRPIQEAMFGKHSTIELTTDEVSRVYEVVNRHVAQFGVHVPFPSVENLIERR